MAREPRTRTNAEGVTTSGQPAGTVTAGTAGEPSRLCPISAKIGRDLSREIDAYAEAHGITRSRAAARYLSIASETVREREGIPAGRADELLDVLAGMRAALHILGPPALGVLRLLAHWSVQTGGLRVSEGELLAELRTVGAEEWEQATAEAERTRRELSQLADELTAAGD
jgi:hypothetical protein